MHSETWRTPEGDAELIRLRSVERKSWIVIGAIFGMSKTACHLRYTTIVPSNEQIKIANGSRRKWSAEDEAKVHHLRHVEKKSYHEIAAIVGLTFGQINSKLERMKLSQKRVHFERNNSRTIVPQRCIDDRTRRQMSARNLTAEFFGDPPPGFSALDKKERAPA